MQALFKRIALFIGLHALFLAAVAQAYSIG